MNYYEQEPEFNTFTDLVVDITHKCNMTCANCYIPNREIPDMDINTFKLFLDRLPGRITIRVIGAEPTMNPNCHLFIEEIISRGHRCVLLTNGLRLAHESYLLKLKQSGLKLVYISMNGVDNNEWYKEIDGLACADKKVKALKNIIKQRLMVDTGTIIVRGVNEEAPGRMIHLLDDNSVDNCVVRIKNVGSIGDYIKNDPMTKVELIDRVSSQMNISSDFITEYVHSNAQGLNSEPNTIIFPMNYKNTGRRGRWVKITDWSGDIPDAGSRRRGRITEDFKIAPFFEHVKLNEGGY